jgi:hypothetical protein
MAVVRNEVLRELRKRGVFIGQLVIEELTFYVFREGKGANPFHHADVNLKDRGGARL